MIKYRDHVDTLHIYLTEVSGLKHLLRGWIPSPLLAKITHVVVTFCGKINYLLYSFLNRSHT